MTDSKDADVAVRRAEIGDAAALADLMTQLGYSTRTSEMEMRMETICADKNYAAFVAISGGKVCGMIGTRISYSFEHNSPGGAILALVVSDKFRGRGVGHALIAAAENDFAQRNIRRLAVYTHFRRTEAHEFYEKLGYAKNGFRLVKELPMPAD
ncbi:MAG TPA: GNAT family N-acetyltransferase [Chthoniobacterales bacterium]|jgi:ribosomal protein S18 acetylase RimI-like enzyme|nr:GNAT family N-acetyltransferase [Chthoniobacterales bacterium]